MIETGDVSDLIDAQLKTQGVSAVSVSDGTVFTFTTEVLEALLSKAQNSGRVVLFVHRGPLA